MGTATGLCGFGTSDGAGMRRTGFIATADGRTAGLGFALLSSVSVSFADMVCARGSAVTTNHTVHYGR